MTERLRNAIDAASASVYKPGTIYNTLVRVMGRDRISGFSKIPKGVAIVERKGREIFLTEAVEAVLLGMEREDVLWFSQIGPQKGEMIWQALEELRRGG